MKFSELCKLSQDRAMQDYVTGLTEDEVDWNEIRDILLDNDDEDEYSEDGEFIDNNTNNR